MTGFPLSREGDSGQVNHFEVDMECQRCGECCYFKLRWDEENNRWWIGRGGGEVDLDKDKPCWFLRYGPGGKAMCIDYERRGKECRDFFCNRVQEACSGDTVAHSDGVDTSDDEHNESDEAK